MGDDFCLGRDPDGAPEQAPKTAVDMREALTAPILGFYDAVRGAEVPVVATVQGRAAGFGCAAAAVCDVTVAADDARFSLPEMKHDLPPHGGHLGPYRPVDAEICRVDGVFDRRDRCAISPCSGLCQSCCSCGELYDRSNEVLATITSRRRTSLETCKTYLANARLMETPQASDYAANLLALVMSSK